MLDRQETVARSARSASLEKREQRARLKASRYHWRAIHEGLAVGYWKGIKTSTWFVRARRPDGTYTVRKLGIADDYQDADSHAVLSYLQAHRKAQGLEQTLRYPDRPVPESQDPLVREVLDDYLVKHRVESSSWQPTAYTIQHLKKHFGDLRVTELSTVRIRHWHVNAAKVRAEDRERKRRARATANRKLTIFKAALNWGWNGPSAVADTWRAVKPFPKVDAPPAAHLNMDEVVRLMNACEPDFRLLVQGTLLVGGRYGEMTALKAANFNAEAGSIMVPTGKTGFREVWLTAEGVEFFRTASAGLGRDDRVFCRSDGSPWGQAHQIRRMRDACLRAKYICAVLLQAKCARRRVGPSHP